MRFFRARSISGNKSFAFEVGFLASEVSKISEGVVKAGFCSSYTPGISLIYFRRNSPHAGIYR